jgi:uncharacterized protein YeaO (DUF488 family)
MLITKCILEKPHRADGLRVSVMRRHALADGVTKDSRIQSFHAHISSLGPSHRQISSLDFVEAYLQEIRQGEKYWLVHWLAHLAMAQDVTILCVEEKCESCHRSALAYECKLHVPRLIIEHR